MDCKSCKLDGATRRLWSCGWIPEQERSGEAPVPSSYPGERPSICPGYLLEMPEVTEACRAHGWRKDGALREFYDGRPITERCKLALDVIGGAFREVEQHNIREAGKKE